MADEHNRLDSKFSVIGAFWVPEQPGIVQTGTFASDEHGMRFSTSPQYKRVADIPLPSSLFSDVKRGRVPVLHGFTENGPCTLCDLTELDRPGRTDYGLEQSVAAITYRVSASVTGMHLGGSGDKCLDSARYTFSGLNEWLPKAISEQWSGDYITLKIPLKARDIVDFSAREARLRITLKVFSEFSSSFADGARISKSVAYVDVESRENESLTWYYQTGNRLENFFSLLTGGSLALETFFVYRGENSGHVTAKSSNQTQRFDDRDCVRCSTSQLANGIAIWLTESREFKRVESLFLGVVRKGRLFVQTEFLSLAQALEGVHRVTSRSSVVDRATFRKVRKKIVAFLKQENVDLSLLKRICDSMSHVNDPTFASRLTMLCQRISDPLLRRLGIDAGQFVADVVATRNFYTHTGSKSRQSGNPESDGELFLLNQKMRSLLRGILLLHLELPETQIAEILQREATRYHLL